MTAGMVQRSCGGIFRSRAECAATSSTLYFKCTRLSDGNCLVTQTPGRRSARAGSVAAQNRRRSSGRHYAACCPRNPRRTCIRRNRSARPQHSAAGPCRNIRSSAGVAAPSSPRNVILSGSSQIGRKTRMTDFPRFGPCYDRSGNLALSFSRSSTIDERTWATLWCGISTSLTRPERSLRSRSTTFKT